MHGLAENLGPARRRAVKADQETQESCLASAVGPEQSQNATGLDAQGDVDERDLAVLIDFGELKALHHQLSVLGHDDSFLGPDTRRRDYTVDAVNRPRASCRVGGAFR